MGKLTGAQHLMKAAGVDPEDPIGSLLAKAGVDPQEIIAVAKAMPELVKAVIDRQTRMELAISIMMENQNEILARLNTRPALPGQVYPVGDDVSDVLDAFHLRNLGGDSEPSETEVEHAQEVSTH